MNKKYYSIEYRGLRGINYTKYVDRAEKKAQMSGTDSLKNWFKQKKSHGVSLHSPMVHTQQIIFLNLKKMLVN